jgi:esterase/lipase superfamily enzyme
MELLTFGHAGAKVLVFPTRQGRFFDYENWGLIGALSPSIECGHLQVFCVDSVDSESLYCGCIPPRARIDRHNQYEQYILHELIPFMRRDGNDSFLIAHGCSIGAYHAVNIALRHPGLFGKIVALSGRYDLTKPIGPFLDLFDGYYDEDIYFHTPTHFLPQWKDPAMLQAMRNTEIVLAVGEDDYFKASTDQLSHQLTDKAIPHTLAVWHGEAHRAYHWRQMVRLYL